MRKSSQKTDADDIIFISPTLFNHITKNIEQQQQQQTSPNNIQGDNKQTTTTRTLNQVSGSEMSSPKSATTDTSASFPSLDPNYILRHAAFDPSILLYGIRGEYERKFQQYQQLWRQKWEELDRINKDLHKQNSEKLRSEVNRVEARYFRDHSHLLEQTPCKDVEQSVLQCYQDNKQKPLLCRSQVKRFASCIEDNRIQLLKQK